MKYPELTGICKKAIENNMCYGCNKLADTHFTGQSKCEYAVDSMERIHKILERRGVK